MSSRSFIRYLALSVLYHIVTAVPQAPLEQASPETRVTGAVPANAEATGSCNACELVADVAGLVWYSQVFLNAQTELVGVGSNNASRTTRTSLLQDEGEFTYNPAATAGPGGALTQINFEPSIIVGGVTLYGLPHAGSPQTRKANVCHRNSPTAYNVFTGYTITSAYSDEGGCSTTTIVSTLPTAYSEILSEANGRVVLDENGQKQFLSYLGFSTCSGGGENFAATALLQVSNSTSTSTTTFSGPLAQQSLSIALVSTFTTQSTPCRLEA